MYAFNTKETFITNWDQYRYESTGTFSERDEFLLVNIYNKATGAIFRQHVLYSNCTGRRLIDIAEVLFLSAPGALGVCGKDELDAVIGRVTQGNMGLGYPCCAGNKVSVYADPTTAGAATAQLPHGVLKYYNKGMELTHEGVVYLQISPTRIGKAWIRKDEFCIATNYDPAEFCRMDAQIEDNQGVPEGVNWRNTGKIKSCE